MTNEFKIVLIGDGGVGKTPLLMSVLLGKINAKGYNNKNRGPTLGVEIHSLDFVVDNTKVRLNVWDCAGTEKFSGFGTGYYIGSQGAIVVSKTEDFGNWEERVKRVCVEVPTIKCVNTFNENSTQEEFNAPFEELVRRLIKDKKSKL
jgi:GTP-binding nuclear protein Ran